MASWAWYWIAALSLVVYLQLKSKRRHPLPLPPGPPADPLIGHVRIISHVEQEEAFQEWGKQYGDVIYLNVLGRSIVVLSSLQAATDILEKKGWNYSSRPDFVAFKLMGWNPTLTFLPYGDRFRKHRKLVQQAVSQNERAEFQSIQTREAHILLQNFISSPSNHVSHIGRFATAIVMEISYGLRVTSDDDTYTKMAERLIYAFAISGAPGSTPVDFFPFLRHFPPWSPGKWFAPNAVGSRPTIRSMHDVPFSVVQKQMAAGTAEKSFVSSRLEALSPERGDTDNDVEDIKGAAGAIWSAGSDTTWSTLLIFILAILLHPESQRRAQEEIDRVVGCDRLPDFGDRPSLPYVECILQETLRWHPTVPLGVPHCSLADDTYKGMFIPKGSLVFANALNITHDENVYSEPHRFFPERYLPLPQGRGEPRSNAGFGFGRRICPGRYLADASIWLAIVSILATLDITKAIGEDGKEITPPVKFTSGGLTSKPKPFKCTIRPRSERTAAVVTQALK